MMRFLAACGGAVLLVCASPALAQETTGQAVPVVVAAPPPAFDLPPAPVVAVPPAPVAMGPPDEPTDLMAPIAHPAPERIKPDTRWKGWEYGFLGLSTVDMIDTAICRSRDSCVERSPLYGRTPSPGRVIAIKTGANVVHFLLVREIAKRDPKAARIAAMVSTFAMAGVVGFNFHSEF